MSFFKKAVSFRKNFLDKHLIGDSLGLLNRAESYLFLKKADDTESFEEVFTLNNNKNADEMELSDSPISVEDNYEAGSDQFEEIDIGQLDIAEDEQNEVESDVAVPVDDFDEEPVFSDEKSSEISSNYNSLEEEKFLQDNDFSDLITEEPLLHEINKNEKNFFLISDKIADEFSKLNIRNDSYNEFNKILYENFNFMKNALLVYSPDEGLFVLKSGNGLDEETSEKLKFDIEYNNIYKEVVKKSYLVIIEKDIINGYSKIFSKNDLADSDFMLIMPFILSNRVIGFFIGLKLEEGNDLSVELINSIEIICKQNGSLLYNIIQNEK